MNLRQKCWKGLGSPVIDASVKKDIVVAYVLRFFRILSGRCGSVMFRKKDYDTRGSQAGYREIL